MGFNGSEYCGLTGLQYDSKQKTYFGIMQGGYPVFVQLVPRRDTFLFRLVAKLPADQTREQLAENLEQWRMEHAGVGTLKYQDRSLSAAVSCAGSDTARAAASVTAELVALAADLGLIPCCMSCGAAEGFSQYLLDGTGITVCGECKTHLESNMQADQQKHEAQKPNVSGLILGAVTGAVIVFLLTFFVLKLGNLSILTAYAGLAAGFLLMKKLGKKIIRPAVILCAVLCMIAGAGASVLHLSGELARSNRENYQQASEIKAAAQDIVLMLDGMTDEQREAAKDVFDDSFYTEAKQNLETASLIMDNQTTGAGLRAFPQFLKHEMFRSELLGKLAGYLLCILISLVIGTVITAPNMLRADSGEHRLLPLKSA